MKDTIIEKTREILGNDTTPMGVLKRMLKETFSNEDIDVAIDEMLKEGKLLESRGLVWMPFDSQVVDEYKNENDMELDVKHRFPQATATSNAAKGVARRAWDSIFWVWSALMVIACMGGMTMCSARSDRDLGAIFFVGGLIGALIGKFIHVWGIWLMTGSKER